jgi:amidase
MTEFSSSAAQSSGAFVETLCLSARQSGPLDGLTFTVKDNIDLAGHRTSFGSPSWQQLHPAAVHHALVVEQLLAAGATCVGKVVADEFTYSLEGESPFWGTPLNAKAPERIPGGSSSGSASSVACGLADFSLGTDSGGSIRVPASFCGVWGMRPSLHRLSEAGVVPFMPSVSTVGVLAAQLAVLDRAIRILLRGGDKPAVPLRRLVMLDDAFQLADPSVRAAAELAVVEIARRTGMPLERASLAQVTGQSLDLNACNQRALRVLQTMEFMNTVGGWIESQQPALGPAFTLAYGNVKAFNRAQAMEGLALCERLFESINAFLDAGTIVCFPTTPTVAPRKGSLTTLEEVTRFYDPTMAITAFAGVARLPEVSTPLLTVDRCPVGLSFAAGHYQDEDLLTNVRALLA